MKRFGLCDSTDLSDPKDENGFLGQIGDWWMSTAQYDAQGGTDLQGLCAVLNNESDAMTGIAKVSSFCRNKTASNGGCGYAQNGTAGKHPPDCLDITWATGIQQQRNTTIKSTGNVRRGSRSLQ